jgi:hypothetical protein
MDDETRAKLEQLLAHLRATSLQTQQDARSLHAKKQYARAKFMNGYSQGLNGGVYGLEHILYPKGQEG